ncbi:HbrB-like-domain-containing protein [Xylaria sp. CBS 124048]|nr:HbrB-like-domain-containing protein [Xylaria sp. CBS 124048]
MQPSRPHQPRAPGSFSPLVPAGSGNPPNSSAHAAAAAAAASAASAGASGASGAAAPSRPTIRRLDTSTVDDTISLPKTRTPQTPTSFMGPAFPNSPGRASPQNFARHGRPSLDAPSSRNASPLTVPPPRSGHGHARKHSQTPGLFEPSMPSTSASNLSQVGMPPTSPALPAQIAAQAALQQHNSRHRSQTVPFHGNETPEGSRPASKQAGGPHNPPLLSLTEASAPRDNAFASQIYHNGLLGSHTAAATTAANVAFPKASSLASSPVPPMPESPMPPPLSIPDKPAKAEKSKVKLFSRPKKIDTKSDAKERPAASPSKIGSALASLQRGNYSTTSLVDSQSFYNLNNSSSATIRPVDSPIEKEVKEKDKERKHNFLSRQKHKLTSKDDHHLPLSSAASNSLPVDPNAPSSLYNFNPSVSPAPSSSFGKSVSGLDLRHGGRALREKRKEEKLSDIMRHENDSTLGLGPEWAGPSSLGSITNNGTYSHEPLDSAKYGLNSMSMDDAWPYLKAKLLVIFEGEDLRIPVEDLNRVVAMHIQYCIQRRSGQAIIDDVRDLLTTGFASLDNALRMTPDDRVIPALVELWMITFTNILPYLQAVFLPLDLEFSGVGPHLAPDQAREFWANVTMSSGAAASSPGAHISIPGSSLNIRQLVLTTYRDLLILPRYEQLKQIFSRLSLEHLPYSIISPGFPPPTATSDGIASLSTSPSDGPVARPGTAMSLDPSLASYYSTTSTVFGDSHSSRSRAISNVSYASGVSDPTSTSGGSLLRPFTPQMRDGDRMRDILGSVREQNMEDSKQVTEMVGRLLQCMSVLASVGTGMAGGPPGGGGGADEPTKMVSELGRLLKLNWLGRGRTGRNRRGIVGARVKQTHVKSNSNAQREAAQDGVGVMG